MRGGWLGWRPRRLTRRESPPELPAPDAGAGAGRWRPAAAGGAPSETSELREEGSGAKTREKPTLEDLIYTDGGGADGGTGFGDGGVGDGGGLPGGTSGTFGVGVSGVVAISNLLLWFGGYPSLTVQFLCRSRQFGAPNGFMFRELD